jgi:hypothetical protein
MTNFGPVRCAVATSVLLVLAVLAVPQAASADAVLYTFKTTVSSAGLTLTSSFSFEVPAIITGSALATITSLLSESDTGSFWTSSACGSLPISSVVVDVPVSAIVESNGNVCHATFEFTAPIDTFGTFVTAV